MNNFKQWFESQDFYTNMRFVHGDALFDKDGDFFRVLAVQIAWEAWQEQQAEIDQLKAQISLQRDRNKALEIELTNSRNHGDELLAFNENLDRERNSYRDQAKTYKNSNRLALSVAHSYFMINKDDPELTVKAMQRALIGTGGS